MRKITGVGSVWLGGLTSSRYEPAASIEIAFDGPLLTWRALAGIFGGDEVLVRADEVHCPEALRTWGKNNDGGYRTGDDLMDLHRKGEVLCVGRKGGLNGSEFQEDLRSGRWRTHCYETARGDTVPNQNWFLLSEFIRKVSRTS